MDKAEYVFEKLAINLTPELAETLVANRAVRAGISSILRRPDWGKVGERTSRQMQFLEKELGEATPEVIKEFNRHNYYSPNRGLESSVGPNLVDQFYQELGKPNTSQTSFLAQLIAKKYKPAEGTKAKQALDDLLKTRPQQNLDNRQDLLNAFYKK